MLSVKHQIHQTQQAKQKLNMSVTRFFYEPYYPLSEFDSLFDEAFSARGNQGQRRRSNNQGSLLNQSIKPR